MPIETRIVNNPDPGYLPLVGGATAGEQSNAPAAAPMVTMSLMMEPLLLARLDRLRACLGDSRSRVAEDVILAGPIHVVEAREAARVARFDQLAADAGMQWWEYAAAYARAFSRQTYPPSVDLLAGSTAAARELRKTIAAMHKEILAARRAV